MRAWCANVLPLKIAFKNFFSSTSHFVVTFSSIASPGKRFFVSPCLGNDFSYQSARKAKVLKLHGYVYWRCRSTNLITDKLQRAGGWISIGVLTMSGALPLSRFKRPTELSVLVYGHTTLKTPVLVRSPKLSNVGPG